MGAPLRVLVVEDSERDEELVVRELGRCGWEVTHRRVETAVDLRAALGDAPWDVVISDYTMPSFTAMDALAIVIETAADLPFIIVSGSIGEETAVSALKAGAHDFFLKDHLQLLGSAVARELRDAAVRRERRSALARLRESEEQLRQAVQARDEFLMIASHELKTPLTPLVLQVGSALAMVRQWGGRASEEGVKKLEAKLEVAERSAERLRQLVATLLDVTRITSGRFEVTLSEIDLGEAARDAVGRWREAFARSGTELSLETRGDVVGRWDRAAVDTILNNLLSNALKFGDAEPVRVAVTREADAARLTVQDRGVGIEAEAQSRIFQRFERAVPSTHYGGFGIGLWVVRQIVGALGGSIHVTSEEGVGSTFTVDLPLRLAADDPRAKSAG